jgi:hypothetical protein
MGKLLGTDAGAIVVSVLLGLGLAAVFRRACKGDGCVVLRAPDAADVTRYHYKVGEDCFRYTPKVVPCPSSGAVADVVRAAAS